jgi:protein tyrosine phosphatase (PTP) superfamily phosphohydrolase (DUF442 family)
MNPRRRSLALCLAATPLYLQGRAVAQGTHVSAPNVVVVSPRLVTSGQPSRSALAALRSQGYEAVIYLAPPTVQDAVRDEAAIVEGQGLAYVNIPIKFNEPTEQDYEAFAAAMAAFSSRKVLVHCQVNMRASSMVFLHRVIFGKEDPERAYEAVARVWSPDGPWKRYIVAMLRKHGVRFEPY